MIVLPSPRGSAFVLPRLALGAIAALVLAGCLGTAGGGGGLAPGLVARMDAPGATLDRTQALGIVNAYRSTTGTAALAADTGLDATAQALATQYANTGTPPATPQGMVATRLSAGYATFAETFSGWRNSPDDASVMAAGNAKRAGLAVAANPASNYGVYWVLVLDD